MSLVAYDAGSRGAAAGRKHTSMTIGSLKECTPAVMTPTQAEGLTLSAG